MLPLGRPRLGHSSLKVFYLIFFHDFVNGVQISILFHAQFLPNSFGGGSRAAEAMPMFFRIRLSHEKNPTKWSVTRRHLELGKTANLLKVHKIENIFGTDFEFYVISLLVVLKY